MELELHELEFHARFFFFFLFFFCFFLFFFVFKFDSLILVATFKEPYSGVLNET